MSILDARIKLKHLVVILNLIIVALSIQLSLLLIDEFKAFKAARSSSPKNIIKNQHDNAAAVVEGKEAAITESSNEYEYHNRELKLAYKYHNYDELAGLLRKYAELYPSKCHLYSIGRSVEQRELWVLAIADQDPDKHLLLRPEIKYVGNMHGNEAPSRELLIYFIDYLLTSQQADAYVDYLLKNARIHILVSLNPDGYEMSIEGNCEELPGNPNANGLNLNRNFPDFFECNNDQVIQPETRSVMNWMNSNQFILSGNFHTGALLVNYAFDNYKKPPSESTEQKQSNSNQSQMIIESPTDDDDIFRYISTIYSFAHSNMSFYHCTAEQQQMYHLPERDFTDGITNGAAWYPISGSMQDYNYWRHGCLETTIELTCCIYPHADILKQLWLDNRKSLIEYAKFGIDSGVRGIIRYENGQPGRYLGVKIDDREPILRTSELGEFYRILLPNKKYKLRFMFDCERRLKLNDGAEFIEIDLTNKQQQLVVLNLTLSNEYYQKSLNVQDIKNKNNFTIYCDYKYKPVELERGCSFRK